LHNNALKTSHETLLRQSVHIKISSQDGAVDDGNEADSDDSDDEGKYNIK
jgi:hypothetical protein